MPANHGEVKAICALTNKDIVVGGAFALAGDVIASSIAIYSPNTLTWSALGSGTNATLTEIAMLATGGILVGGSFDTARRATASSIA